VFRTASQVVKMKIRRPLKRIPISTTSCEKHALFFSAFPYLCPEPVLAKRSFLHENGAKKELCFRTSRMRR
jgi:hypothetical protein